MKTLLPIKSSACGKASSVLERMRPLWGHIGFFAILLLLLLPANAVAQITLRGSTENDTGGTTLTINKLGTLAVGDVMIAQILQSGSTGSNHDDAISAGWTFIAGSNMTQGGSNNRYRGTLLYKIAVATDVSATNFSFTLDPQSGDGQGAIAVFTGVDIAGGVDELGAAGGPFDVDPGNGYTGLASDNTYTATAITTASANAAVILFGMVTDNTNSSSYNTSSPGTLTEIYDLDFNAGLDMGIAAAWATKSSIGSTGTGTANLGASVSNGALLIALKRFTGTISTGTVTGPICAGSSIAVPYSITGTYASGNLFTAQLSSSSGSFASPTTIGSVVDTEAGTITATIPAGQGAGSGYRVRVISNFPPATGTNNGTNLTIVAPPTATAGPAFSACSTATSIAITGGASSGNNSGILWTSNGTGTISNATSINGATYAPGIGEAGTVTFTVTANGNGPCNPASATKILTLVAPPTATAGGSATICSNQNTVVSGATSSNGNIVWTENGAGSITSGANTLTPTYTAAVGDGGNTVTLTMTVTNATCGSVQATYTVNVTAAPVVSAGNAFAICTNDGATNITSGASASHYSSVAWTSNGTGTISNPDSLTTATYTPGPGETGTVTLTLSASGNAPCAGTSATKVLTILGIPSVTAVSQCQGQPSQALVSATVCPLGAAVSAGPNTSGTAVNQTGVGSVAWSNPGNITSAGTPYATAATTFAISNYLRAGNYGFAIPANATITGIQLAINRQGSSTTLGITDNSVKLVKSGTIVGTEKAASATWGTSFSVANYGGVADLWGTTWTVEDVNDAAFGAVLATTSILNRTATVDYMRISITYQLPGDLNWYTVSSGGAAIGTGSSFDPVGVANSGLTDTNTPGTTTYYVECSTVAGCRAPVNYVINALPTVSFTGLAASYCENSAAVTLNGNHATGVFSGSGITDNANGTASFNPAASTVGAHQITFTYTDANSCVNSAVQSVNILQNVTYYEDFDGDGFGNLAVTSISCNGAPVGFVANSTDCDDNDNTKNQTFAFFTDGDGDGFGTGSALQVCAVNATTPPAGYSINNTDCDDTDNTKNQTFGFYADLDGDGFGAGSSVQVCAVDALTPPAGYSLSSTDCDDDDNTKNQTFAFYVDADGDGIGWGSLVAVCAVDASTPPTGYALVNTDCDDTDGTIFQTATFYIDTDGDGYSTNESEIVCYGASTPAGYVVAPTTLDCNDAVAAINPGQTEMLYNGVDDNCDGNLDEGNQIMTKLLPSFCGATLTSMGSVIGITTLAPGAAYTGWRVRITNGAQVQIIETYVPHFQMTQLASYAYATTYTVEVELQRNGVWLGYYGPSCLLSTPAVLAEGGAASVTGTLCGQTMPKINTLIATTSLPGVTGYRFKITNLTDQVGPFAEQILTRSLNWFTLQMLTRYNYGTTYRIEIAVKTTGDFGGYGAPCEIYSPAAPALVNCGGTATTGTQTISATSVQGVTQYRFQITRSSDSASTTMDRGVNYFTFNQVPANIFTAGALYYVRVAVMTSNTWSPFGDACEITAPGGSAKGDTPESDVLASNFKATAYPNPYTADFSLELTGASQEMVNLKVYDMLGKLLEDREVSGADIAVEKVGAHYPAGVYNIIVNQGGNTRTLRVIKR